MLSTLAKPCAGASTVSTQSPNWQWLEQIIRAQRQGRTCLPNNLGLGTARFQALLQQLGLSPLAAPAGDAALARECSELRAELLNLRRDEWDDLHGLLLAHRRGPAADHALMAEVVASACMGSEHLWRDLGLDSRQHLFQLLEYNFPTLTARNVQDMRWKKFFYKQLCEQEGGYICRSPSCEHCPTYHDCFGEER